MFIDKIKIEVKAGNGGNGAVAFHREKYVSAGGPDGGDGGHGGNIIFRVDKGANTLLAFRYKRKFAAGHGENGAGSKFHGATADDLYILVPPGTLIREAESGRLLHDMSENDGADYLCCKGGRGGFGNRHFATATRQLPMFAKNGTRGEEKELILELKMIADVGLIGYPSVGKSSILSRISAAKPKIADYHFTTLQPNLGVVSTGDESGFVAADIPGHDFLRHIERCRLLLHVVDVAGVEYRDPIEDVKAINRELAEYSDALAKRPQILVANKCDLIDRDAEEIGRFEAFAAENGFEVCYVSAITGEGLPEMIRRVSKKLATLPPVLVFEPDAIVTEEIQETAEDITIRFEKGTYFVEGEWLYNLVGRTNFSDYESLNYFQRTLAKNGVFEKLEAAGCRDGHTVSIYDFEFDYVK